MIYKAVIFERVVPEWRKRQIADALIVAPDKASAAECARRVAKEEARDQRHTWFTLEVM